jgi:hypothetical protein
MRLGELVRLPLVPKVLLDLLEVLAGRFLFVRRLAPARVSELAHTSMLRTHAEPGRVTPVTRQYTAAQPARVLNIRADRHPLPLTCRTG